MYDTPAPLLELCLDCIVERHAEIFATCYVRDEPDERRARAGELEERKAFCFPDADFYLFNKLSEQLLERFNSKRRLDDRTLNLFRSRNTRLKCVRISDTPAITPEGLRTLREHKLTELHCTRMESLTVGLILDCLSEDTIRNLTSLDVSRCTFIDISRHSMMMHLTNLKQLKSLNVSFTEFNQQTLEMICEDLTQLEYLNISGTWVQCVKPLLLLKHRLLALVASDLRWINLMTQYIIKLDMLRHLDISLIHERFESIQNTAICDILESPETLPNLVSLDISGWRDLIPKGTMLTYLKHHPRMKYLGLVLNPIAFELFLSEPEHDPETELELRVAGLGNEEQIILALRRHYDRHNYVQKALYHLFQLTDGFAASRSDVFQLVILAMATHPKRFGVQMAATACLYNLTRGEISKQIHPKYLSRAVDLTLDAMESFPGEYQLQKNALLTLCSDRILQDVDFDRYRCAKIVLDSLCTFEEVNMNRMSVAICSILAAKISTRETSELGGQTAYMKKLLAMVQQRVDNGNSDITMKFTLSALWNLTDESAATCAVFLENGGAELFLDVLKVFKTDTAVETKVLGLLNNIAEVDILRGRLLVEPLVQELYGLLTYDMIDVSYFAAGIVAHLASDGADSWTVHELPREKLLQALEAAVVNWGVPDNEMVAYRSFKPFFPLLKVGVDYRVQLWAVWAVHHVCTKNSKRYCDMLKEEHGVELLQNLIDDANTHEMAVDKCREVLRHISPPTLFDLRTSIVCTATIIDATTAALGGGATRQQVQELRQ